MDPVLTIGYNVWFLTMWFPMSPWMNWTTVHADFSRVDRWPTSSWRADYIDLISIELSRWISVINAITFFLLFGMTDEARRNYKVASQFIAKRLGYQTGQSGSSKYVVRFNLIKKKLRTDPSCFLLIQIYYSLETSGYTTCELCASHDIFLATFSENQRPAPDKLNPLEFIGRDGQSSITSLKDFDTDLKHGFSFECPPSSDLDKTFSTMPQFRIPRIPPPAVPLDPESARGGLQLQNCVREPDM